MVGMNRKDIICLIDPKIHTEVISHFKGEAILIERVLEFIQNEQIVPMKLSNITLVRHPFVNKLIPEQVSSTFGEYDFRGGRMIFYFVGAPFIVPIFANSGSLLSDRTGNLQV
jgi:hypothetical protein